MKSTVTDLLREFQKLSSTSENDHENEENGNENEYESILRFSSTQSTRTYQSEDVNKYFDLKRRRVSLKLSGRIWML